LSTDITISYPALNFSSDSTFHFSIIQLYTYSALTGHQIPIYPLHHLLSPASSKDRSNNDGQNGNTGNNGDADIRIVADPNQPAQNIASRVLAGGETIAISTNLISYANRRDLILAIAAGLQAMRRAIANTVQDNRRHT